MTSDPVLDPARLAALRASGLLEPSRHVDFERLTTLAARLLKVPVALVTLVDEKRQIFIGACRMAAAPGQTREIPLSHSFCQHAVRERRPLVIRDATKDPRAANGIVAGELAVQAYLGFPLLGPDNHVLGTFCVIDSKPRDWNESEISLVRDLTAMAAEQVELHVTKQMEQSTLDVLIHDLKSPLAGIRMAATLLQEREDELPESLRPLAGVLGSSTDNALNLIESLAGGERRSAGVGPDLNAVLGGLADKHRPEAEAKGIVFDLHREGPPLPLAVAEWVVEQVGENLLANAIKFTPPGGTLTVTARAGNGMGIFEVADSGPGFQPEDLAKLYRRYARMSAQPTAGEPSTGLGLSIVKRLIDQAGGTIELVSQPGSGAVFRVALPLSDE